MTSRYAPRRRDRDHGSVLILVLVITVVLSIVVIGLAKYATTTLRMGQVSEASADRLATADGAMDNALEDIARNASACLLFDQDYTVTDTINGITANITCDWVGGEPGILDDFAVIITGDGTGRTGEMLTVTNAAGTDKIFEGPLYLGAPPSAATIKLQAPLTIKSGDLYYTSGSGCPGSVTLPGNLTLTPAGYTTKCWVDPWTTLFQTKKPPEPAVGSFAAPAAVTTDSLGCNVWSPGHYTTAPTLANHSYNYFKSGDYYFDNLGTWDIDSAFVLMGWPGSTGPGIDGPDSHDTFANNPCRNAWNETDHSGATLYLGGNSNVRVSQNATFEVSGKLQGTRYNVGIQALEGAGVASTVRGDQTIVNTGSGSNKQISIQGLVWAPYASFVFDLISNDAVAALTGGAVVGELSAGASASANNFVIKVDTQPTTSLLNLTATAANGGVTSVKTVLDVRTAGVSSNYAVHSRRVLYLTPE
jgi:hypothetical protein